MMILIDKYPVITEITKEGDCHNKQQQQQQKNELRFKSNEEKINFPVPL